MFQNCFSFSLLPLCISTNQKCCSRVTRRNCINLSKVIKNDQVFNKTFFRAGKVFKEKDTSMNISFAARKFRPFFPTYFYNYISNDTINPQRDTIRIFFPNQDVFLIFEKRQRRTPLPLHCNCKSTWFC